MTITENIIFVVGGTTIGAAIIIYIIARIPKRWDGVPAADFKRIKCTVCSGGVQTIVARHGKVIGWKKIPEQHLLLNRRPDAEGGDKWGTPLATLRDCPCCQGKGFHLVPRGESAAWLDCSQPATDKSPVPLDLPGIVTRRPFTRNRGTGKRVPVPKAHLEHDCPVCGYFITRGEEVAAVANDALITGSVAPVWGHEPCARLHRDLNEGDRPPVYSTGRLRVQAQQGCARCRISILSGDIGYRVVLVPSAAASTIFMKPVYILLCQSCHHAQNSNNHPLQRMEPA